MTPAEMAMLHGTCFVVPRPWTAAEFESYVNDPACVICVGQGSLAVARVIADEAEVLTIAVDPTLRRSGFGQATLQDLLHKVAAHGAQTVFLEVAEDNAAARALYQRAGFSEVGRRSGYYAGVDALTLRKALAMAHVNATTTQDSG